jgi:fused signal recognition particle receptor
MASKVSEVDNFVFDKFSDKLRDRFKRQQDEAAVREPQTTEPAAASAAPAVPPSLMPTPSAVEPSAGAARATFFERLKSGLKKTRDVLNTDVRDLFNPGRKLDDNFWQSLEDVLLKADVGVLTTGRLIDAMKAAVKERGITQPNELTDIFKQHVGAILSKAEGKVHFQAEGPTVIFVVGVNGTGKTTSIGKLAWQLKSQGKKVILGAADTFRAAAIDQLQIWADRVGVDIVRLAENADPAAVAFDAVQAAKARGADVLLLDTAGRLHSKVNLMEELKKVRRVTAKQLPGAPHETLLVLDATTGQNAMAQARTFGEAVEVTGLVLAKLDGTARGGIVVAIADDLGIPVKYIGVGEGIEDLRPFEAGAFVDALFATETAGV